MTMPADTRSTAVSNIAPGRGEADLDLQAALVQPGGHLVGQLASPPALLSTTMSTRRA